MGISGQTVGRKDRHSEREWCLRKNFILLEYDVTSFGNRLFVATYVPFFIVRNVQEDIAQINVCRWGRWAASKRRYPISERRNMMSQKDEICYWIAV